MFAVLILILVVAIAFIVIKVITVAIAVTVILVVVVVIAVIVIKVVVVPITVAIIIAAVVAIIITIILAVVVSAFIIIVVVFATVSSHVCRGRLRGVSRSVTGCSTDSVITSVLRMLSNSNFLRCRCCAGACWLVVVVLVRA